VRSTVALAVCCATLAGCSAAETSTLDSPWERAHSAAEPHRSDSKRSDPGPSAPTRPDPSEREQRLLDARLLAAAWRNDVSAARRLISRGADVNAKDDTVRAPTWLPPARATSTCWT